MWVDLRAALPAGRLGRRAAVRPRPRPRGPRRALGMGPRQRRPMARRRHRPPPLPRRALRPLHRRPAAHPGPSAPTPVTRPPRPTLEICRGRCDPLSLRRRGEDDHEPVVRHRHHAPRDPSAPGWTSRTPRRTPPRPTAPGGIPQARRWFDPRPTTPELQRWAALPELPDLLPGEDRTFKLRPVRRSHPDDVLVHQRPQLRRTTGLGPHPPDGDPPRRLRLRGLRSDREPRRRAGGSKPTNAGSYDSQAPACSRCAGWSACAPTATAVTHYGLAEVQGTADEALQHLMSVNGLDLPNAKRHIAVAFDYWRARSRRTWTLDLSPLTEQGIELITPRPPNEPGHERSDGPRSRPRRPRTSSGPPAAGPVGPVALHGRSPGQGRSAGAARRLRRQPCGLPLTASLAGRAGTP